MSVDELVAKALYDAEIDFPANAEVWPFETEPVRQRLLGEAAGIINMLDAAGLVIVPKEATDAMVWNGAAFLDHPSLYMGGPSQQNKRKAAGAYSAMIKAATE